MKNFQHTIHPTAICPHVCDECKGLIDVGEVHIASYGVENNDFFSFRLDSTCYDLLRTVNADRDFESSIPVGDLKDHLSRHGTPEEKVRFHDNKLQRLTALKALAESEE